MGLAPHLGSGPSPQTTDAQRARGEELQANRSGAGSACVQRGGAIVRGPGPRPAPAAARSRLRTSPHASASPRPSPARASPRRTPLAASRSAAARPARPRRRARPPRPPPPRRASDSSSATYYGQLSVTISFENDVSMSIPLSYAWFRSSSRRNGSSITIRSRLPSASMRAQSRPLLHEPRQPLATRLRGRKRGQARLHLQQQRPCPGAGRRQLLRDPRHRHRALREPRAVEELEQLQLELALRVRAERRACRPLDELAEERARILPQLVERPGHAPTVPGGPDESCLDGLVTTVA